MSTRKESAKEENLNVLTHAFGLLLSIVGLYFLLQNERMFNLPVTQDYFYNLTNNFSIFFFFLVLVF